MLGLDRKIGVASKMGCFWREIPWEGFLWRASLLFILLVKPSFRGKLCCDIVSTGQLGGSSSP